MQIVSLIYILSGKYGVYTISCPFCAETDVICRQEGFMWREGVEILALIYRQYIFFGPFFVFVLALAKLISKEKHRINYIYSQSYLFMGLGMVQGIAYSIQPFPGYYYVSQFLIPFTFGTSYFLYLRFRFLIQGTEMRVSPVALLTLAVLFVFLAAGPLLPGMSFTEQNAALRPLIDHSFKLLPLYYKIVHVFNFSAKVILAGGLLTLLIRTGYLWRERDTGSTMMARVAYIFTIMMFVTLVLAVAGDLFSFAFSRASLAMIVTVTLCVFFASQYDPDYYAIFKFQRKKKKYIVSKVRNMDVDSVIVNLGRLMEEHYLYREEKVTLKSLADIIDINPQQLSEILNRELNKSFSAYVNDFRILEAKKLLTGQPDLPVIRIALMTGFNSVRTFNRVFIKNEGITPIAYRKKHICD